MEPEVALEGLEEFVETSEFVNVLVGADLGPELPMVLQRLVLGEDATESFRNSAWNTVPPADSDVVLKPYDPTYKPDRHELLYLDLDEFPEIVEMVEAVAAVDEVGEFDEDKGIVTHLTFYAVVCTDNNDQAVFFRNYGPKKELSRKRGFALVKRHGQYDHLEEKVFLFDDDIDCFAWSGFLFVWNSHQFRRIFRYFEQLREQADQIIERVTKRVPIQNEDEFRNFVSGQMTMLAKVASIARRPYLEDLTMTAIRKAIDEFELDVDIEEDDDGTEQLVFDPAPARRWLILKLLDDDYLESVMTDLRYETNSKMSL